MRNKKIIGNILVTLRLLFWTAIFLFSARALTQQSQGVMHDITVVGWIIAFTALVVFCLLSYERYVRKLRKKTRGRHRLVRLWDATERWKEFQCICGTGGKIYLGLQWAIWVNGLFFTLVVVMSLWSLVYGNLFMATAVVLACGVCMWNYFSIYQDMRRHKHSAACSRKAALRSILYTMQASYPTIYKTKKP